MKLSKSTQLMNMKGGVTITSILAARLALKPILHSSMAVIQTIHDDNCILVLSVTLQRPAET